MWQLTRQKFSLGNQNMKQQNSKCRNQKQHCPSLNFKVSNWKPLDGEKLKELFKMQQKGEHFEWKVENAPKRRQEWKWRLHTDICIHYAATINHGLFPAPDIGNILVNILCIGASNLGVWSICEKQIRKVTEGFLSRQTPCHNTMTLTIGQSNDVFDDFESFTKKTILAVLKNFAGSLMMGEIGGILLVE